MRVSPAAGLEVGRLAKRKRQLDLVRVRSVDLFHQVRELRAHPRIHLDDRHRVPCRIEKQLHVEHAIVEADPGDETPCDVLHAALNPLRKARGVLEALEADGPRIHHRVRDRQQPHASAVDERLQGDLHACQQLLRQQVARWQRQVRVALQKLVERPREFRDVAAGLLGDRFELGRIPHGLRKDRKEGLHGLHEKREGQRRLGLLGIDQPHPGRRIGNGAMLLQATVVLVLAQQDDGRVDVRQPQLAREHVAQDAAGIVVRAHHGVDVLGPNEPACFVQVDHRVEAIQRLAGVLAVEQDPDPGPKRLGDELAPVPVRGTDDQDRLHDRLVRS